MLTPFRGRPQSLKVSTKAGQLHWCSEAALRTAACAPEEGAPALAWMVAILALIPAGIALHPSARRDLGPTLARRADEQHPQDRGGSVPPGCTIGACLPIRFGGVW